MPRLRGNAPCFWVTWLNGFLAVENSHESVSQELAPGDFDRAGWQMAHTAMVNEVRGRWEELGCEVFTERQNGFRLRGESGTLGGRPDLIARRGDAGTIIDVKTGKPGVAHIVQVMLYMYAVPRAMGMDGGSAPGPSRNSSPTTCLVTGSTVPARATTRGRSRGWSAICGATFWRRRHPSRALRP